MLMIMISMRVFPKLKKKVDITQLNLEKSKLIYGKMKVPGLKKIYIIGNYSIIFIIGILLLLTQIKKKKKLLLDK